jgi:hypothetical protein
MDRSNALGHLSSPSNLLGGGGGVMPLSRNRAFGDKPNSAPIRRVSSMACEAIRTSGLTRGWPSAVLIVNSPALQRLFRLLPMGIGAAVGAERADIEKGEQVKTM